MGLADLMCSVPAPLRPLKVPLPETPSQIPLSLGSNLPYLPGRKTARSIRCTLRCLIPGWPPDVAGDAGDDVLATNLDDLGTVEQPGARNCSLPADHQDKMAEPSSKSSADFHLEGTGLL